MRKNANLVEKVVYADFSDNQCFGDRAASKLVKVFSVMTNLTELSLANTRIDNLGFVLVECVKSLPNLVVLDLSKLHFECSLITNFLLVSQWLKELHLTHCNISDSTPGSEALVMTGLERLDLLNLCDNRLGFKTGSLILKTAIEGEGYIAKILL